MNTSDNGMFEEYKAEAQAKWGATDAYKQYQKNTKDYSAQQWNNVADGMDCIMAEFADCLKQKIASLRQGAKPC